MSQRTDTLDEPAQPAGRIATRIAVMGFLGGIGGGVVYPIVPAIGERLGLSAFMIGVILAANRVVRLAANPVTGSLTDRFGGREVIAAGLFTEGIGTLGYVGALHFSLPGAWFLAGRIVWGVGSSLLFVGVVAAVLALTAASDRGRLVGRTRSAISLGVPGGLVTGGLVSEFVSADAAFLIAALLSAAAGVAALYGIPRRKPRAATAKPRKTARAGEWLSVLLDRRLLGIWLYSGLVVFAIQGVLLATLEVMVRRRAVHVFGLDAEASAGLLMALLMLAYAAASVLIGRQVDVQHNRTRLLLPAVLAMVAGYALLAFSRVLPLLLLALPLVGVGAGAIAVPTLALLGDWVPTERHGRATAIFQVAADIGSALGAILGLVLGTRYGFDVSYAGLAAVFALTLPAAVVLIRTERKLRTPIR